MTESTSKHTPGPWYVDNNERGAVWVHSDNAPASGICDLYHTDRMDRIHTKDRAEANARLIASAPDLLEALKAAGLEMGRMRNLLHIEIDHERPTVASLVAKLVEDAIAKAEGKS